MITRKLSGQRDWISWRLKRRYPTLTILRNMAQEIIQRSPSKAWATGFVKRHGGTFGDLGARDEEIEAHR